MTDEARLLTNCIAYLGDNYVGYHVADILESLAKAYIAEHDPTPIDEAWLRSVGFVEIDSWGRNQKQFTSGIVRCVAFATEGPKCWDWRLEIFIGRGAVTITSTPTRGDVRRLMEINNVSHG